MSTLQKDKTRVFWGGQRSQHREQGNQIFFHVHESCASSSEPSSNETNEDFFYLCFRKKFLLYSVPLVSWKQTNFAVTFHALNQNHIFILESKARFWEKSRTKRNTLDLFISIIEWILAVFFLFIFYFLFFFGGGVCFDANSHFPRFCFSGPWCPGCSGLYCGWWSLYWTGSQALSHTWVFYFPSYSSNTCLWNGAKCFFFFSRTHQLTYIRSQA